MLKSWCIFGALVALVGFPAHAQNTLMGREVVLQVVTYDDPVAPLFQSNLQRSTVSDAVEFGLVREGGEQELDVVPVLVDISDGRITLNYKTAPPGALAPAQFNGYVMSFSGTCVAFQSVSIDRGNTTLPVSAADVKGVANGLEINVQGLRFNRKSRIAIDFEIVGCSTAPGSKGKKSRSP